MTNTYTYTKKGIQLYFEDEFLEAIKNFNKAIEREPEDSDFWYFRGRSKYFLNQYEEAIKDLDKAIKLDHETYRISLHKECIIKLQNHDL